MWIIFTLGLIFIGFLVYVKIRTRNSDLNYYEEYKNIFDEHRRIGFPSLEKELQFEILDNENMQSVASLTKYAFVPTGLMEYYLTIEPDEYLEHLRNLNLINLMRFDPKEQKDGYYINIGNLGCDYIFVEKGRIEFRKSFRDYDQLLRYLVYVRLKMHAPKSYKDRLTKEHYA